ncbi:uncharacterized protein yc1106_07624 [Curvularia clavata]|uniref:DUF7730 domain-containing protein n=1 Tax=Curvularia clavata TaxID=95742 RepID=A0A9Q9DVW4_CURCL|nr:uncharacterized protein yc1106_07624 [Curvularia clavata]
MAFGGRTLHIDIVQQNEAWQSRGAVCNRNLPGLLPSMQYTCISPLNEQCPECYSEGKGRDLESYNMGIMGFLLSCRQAYTEGIEFLYSTNSINIQSEALLLQLPQLIFPNRLACIKALEIVIRVHHIQQEESGLSLNIDHLKPILDHIVAHCHSLHSICISFVTQSWGSGKLNGLALPLVDDFYQTTRLRDMRVELPPGAYGAAFKSESLNDPPREAPLIRRFPRSIWRSLDDEVPVVQRRSLERYPYPPLRWPALGGEDKNIESAGYWVSIGFEETIRSPMVCF